MTEELKNYIYQLISSVRTNGAYPAENFVSTAVDKAILKAKSEGAKQMRDYIMLSGYTIDGVDYIGLKDVIKRSRECLKDISEIK